VAPLARIIPPKSCPTFEVPRGGSFLSRLRVRGAAGRPRKILGVLPRPPHCSWGALPQLLAARNPKNAGSSTASTHCSCEGRSCNLRAYV
jgi:hypothetical protein